MHIDITIHGTLHLDGLCAVSFLRVQLTTVHLLDLHHITLRMLPAGVVRRRDDCLPGGIETKVCVRVNIDKGLKSVCTAGAH